MENQDGYHQNKLNQFPRMDEAYQLNVKIEPSPNCKKN